MSSWTAAATYYERDARDVVRDWREVLHEIEAAGPGLLAAERAIAEVRRLQDEYFGLREAAYRTGRALPPLPPE
jgi:hypothetical protein